MEICLCCGAAKIRTVFFIFMTRRRTGAGDGAVWMPVAAGQKRLHITVDYARREGKCALPAARLMRLISICE
jgi:hypothetical protein